MNSRDCIVCGGAYKPSKITGLLQCVDCRFVTANLHLTPEELSHLYSAKYFSGEEYKDYLAEQPLIEKHFALRLRTLMRFVDEPQKRSLFEIGSAYGFFLNVARRHFRRVAGIDISREATAYAREQLGLPVFTGDFLHYAFDDAPEVICLWDTIEHLDAPDRYLEKIAQELPSGGIVAITTGDIESWLARMQGARWRQIHPPTHLHYFSRGTLSRLLRNVGFQVVYCGYEGMYRSVDTMAYILLNLRSKRSGLYRWLKRLRLLEWNVYLNLYDILYLIARKT